MTPDAKPEQETPVFFGKGMIALIIGIVVILLIILAAGMIRSDDGSTVSPSDCGVKAMQYINTNIVIPQTSAEFLSIAEYKGLYQLKIRYQSEAITLYTTKDCTLLFSDALDITGPAGIRQNPQAAPAPVKTARPAVDLYVMSFCPYGTQAETVMKPVVDLLGSKADIRLRYVVTVTGTTAESVDSLHGLSEAKEDMWQACIKTYYPDQIWAYLESFNDVCYPSWQKAEILDTCRKNTTAALGIDSAKIDACAGGEEGLALMKADQTEGSRLSIYSSPTLVINGVKYSGARTPEAFKQAICSSFETAPAECETVLSSVSSAAAGGC